MVGRGLKAGCVLLDYIPYTPCGIPTMPNIVRCSLGVGVMDWSPAGHQALATVKLGETTIITKKGQLLALQDVDQCSRDWHPRGRYLGLQKPVREVCTQSVCVPGKDSQINPADAEEDTGPVRKETGLRK